VKTACLKIQISSYQRNLEQNLKNQLAQGLVTVQFRLLLPVEKMNEREKKSLVRKIIVFGCYQNFLGYLGYFGIRRLAAEEG